VKICQQGLDFDSVSKFRDVGRMIGADADPRWADLDTRSERQFNVHGNWPLIIHLSSRNVNLLINS
jgi:hypothetical protein